MAADPFNLILFYDSTYYDYDTDKTISYPDAGGGGTMVATQKSQGSHLQAFLQEYRSYNHKTH
jgi:hypothetical protein